MSTSLCPNCNVNPRPINRNFCAVCEAKLYEAGGGEPRAWHRAIVTIPITRILEVLRGRARIVGLPRQYRTLHSYETHERASICFVIESPEFGPEFEHAEGCHYREIPVTWHYSTGVELIAVERAQHARFGFDTGHDAEHKHGELAMAAATYALYAVAQVCGGGAAGGIDEARERLIKMWPFKEPFLPAHDPLRNLAKAGSLVAAEADRQLARP